MRIIKTILFVIGVIVSPLISAAQNSPIPMLEETANNIIATLKENKSSLKSNPNIIYKAVETHLLPIVDVVGMSRSVLGRQAWTKATNSQRAQFSKAFTRLVIRTYSSPLAQYADESVQFLPLRGSLNSRFIRVNSIIVRTEGQNIPLSYSLVDKNGQWKIYDISVEGVSLLQSFRSQFAQALQNSSIDDLIKLMEKKQLKRAS
ncbi:phospholipid-binding protein MlaC [Legionella longbeachae]|uniref:Signal peptide protein, toluene tolerance protein Ttg2D n=1 Tax=Legionella longbeachae serogroup 1 (strain NSW150) TaxID=661367 RepID=D3HJ24_LEGLN|nr:ABC transporter substrate-binding protein [Legionella longbeachae]VEE02912.1 signal peptide protein, toluene tolerance protein Ttg2D [Legionella oakridgensis]HBD7398885.1 ABC transporter substrate-binding protein [Legionella pneumophila]ARB90847.1 signal peptidase [Legionella longbeachae]ARM32727.1 ABC transporter substrate-binding protein [Legionella longbeachae]EEZ94489.1 toluene tolerance protein Ttg2D [Legionella longbeachae D-4968]